MDEMVIGATFSKYIAAICCAFVFRWKDKARAIGSGIGGSLKRKSDDFEFSGSLRRIILTPTKLI
jgi:hypothetical protein